MKGRKPVPTALKVLRGNPGKRPINRDEPTPPPLDPAVPAELADGAAAAEWTRTITPATTTGHITSADRVIAIAHCELWALWRAQLENPAHAPAALKTVQVLLRVDAELGLTPTSRARVKVPTRRAVDPVEDRFFTRRA